MPDRTTQTVQLEGIRLDLLARLARDRTNGGLGPLSEYVGGTPAPLHREIAEAWFGLTEETLDGSPESQHAKTLGPYRLIRELGRGGQAVVWLAEDLRVGRQVALKTAPQSPLFGELAPRLQREALALARVGHEGLCEIYDVGAAQGLAWIAMRFEEGRTLAERLAADTPTHTTHDVLQWMEGAARALHAAHEAGFLHRDVKPSNLMIRETGQVVVLDFGIAKSDETPVPLTLTGEELGTPGYISPEGLALDRGELDRRADVWALGVTLFEALEGARPFTAPTRDAEARRALRGDRDPLGPVEGVRQADLETVLAAALAVDPKLRYESAQALADDLERLRDGAPPLTRRPGPVRRLHHWAHRHPTLAGLWVVLTAALLVAVLLLVRSNQHLRDFRRLADLETSRELLAGHASLLPLSRETASRMTIWLKRTDELLARRARHEDAIARYPRATAASWDHDGDRSVEWMRSQLEELLTSLDRLRELKALVEPRAALAAELVRLADVEHVARWRAAADRVTADARFKDFELRPVYGLVPLGPDPASGLEEFAHLPTGTPATRNTENGRLERSEGTGVVLVLVPFGETLVGSSPPDANVSHPDPKCGPWDGPPQELSLDPFLVSKYELTQSQWRSWTGEEPSANFTGVDDPTGSRALHPVENVTIARVASVLGEMGLALPTEAQWEHCARARSRTPWSFGEDGAGIAAHGNIADPGAERIGVWSAGRFTSGVDDGYAGHAPVGSYAANDWGLHDVHGNVQEATRSSFVDWRVDPPADGEGEVPHRFALLVPRGGSFYQVVEASRSSARNGVPDNVQVPNLGARPVLLLRR